METEIEALCAAMSGDAERLERLRVLAPRPPDTPTLVRLWRALGEDAPRAALAADAGWRPSDAGEMCEAMRALDTDAGRVALARAVRWAPASAEELVRTMQCVHHSMRAHLALATAFVPPDVASIAPLLAEVALDTERVRLALTMLHRASSSECPALWLPTAADVATLLRCVGTDAARMSLLTQLGWATGDAHDLATVLGAFGVEQTRLHVLSALLRRTPAVAADGAVPLIAAQFFTLRGKRRALELMTSRAADPPVADAPAPASPPRAIQTRPQSVWRRLDSARGLYVPGPEPEPVPVSQPPSPPPPLPPMTLPGLMRSDPTGDAPHTWRADPSSPSSSPAERRERERGVAPAHDRGAGTDACVSVPEPPSGGEPEEDDLREEEACVVCMARRRALAPVDCGHRSMCHACAGELCARGQPRCPVCRAPIARLVRVYG